MNDTLEEITLTRREVFRGHIFTAYSDTARLPDGSEAPREYIAHPGGAGVAAVTDEGELLMVRQYRYGVGRVTLEIPAGKLEPGEDPAAAIRRELSEETGCTADRWSFLGELYPTPAYCGEITYLYLAEGLHGGAAHPDDDEFLDVERIPLTELYRMAAAGELPDAKTQVAVLRLLARSFGTDCPSIGK